VILTLRYISCSVSIQQNSLDWSLHLACLTRHVELVIYCCLGCLTCIGTTPTQCWNAVQHYYFISFEKKTPGHCVYMVVHLYCILYKCILSFCRNNTWFCTWCFFIRVHNTLHHISFLNFCSILLYANLFWSRLLNWHSLQVKLPRLT
jgi:hypothetical protein